MRSRSCPREDQTVAAALQITGLGAEADELRAHVADCDVCCEVAEVTRILRDDHQRAHGGVRVPAAGQVWWRAAVRARLEAAHVAARPLTWLYGVAAACALGLGGALVDVAWPFVRDVTAWIGTMATGAAQRDTDMAASLIVLALRASLPLAAAVAVGLVLAPIALYFALADD